MESSRPLWYLSNDGGLRLTSSRWKAYLRKYKNVSEEELIEIRDSTFDKKSFERMAEILNRPPPTGNRDITDTDDYDDDDLERVQFPTGLTPSKWRSYRCRYKNVSRRDLIAIRDSTIDVDRFECMAEILDRRTATDGGISVDDDDDDDDADAGDLFRSSLRRSNGSIIIGVTPSKWRAYLKRYKNVSEQDLIKIRDASIRPLHFHKRMFEFHNDRFESEAERLNSAKATPTSNETIYPFGQLDGCFLTSSEWRIYLKKYPNVSERELIEIRDSIDFPDVYKNLFESFVEDLNVEKEIVKRDGLPATLALPLFMLLSVHVKPTGEKKPFSVYGEITHHRPPIHYREYLYKRQFEDVEKFGSDGGNLTLSGPSHLCRTEVASYTLESRKLLINLYDETQRILAHGCVDLSYSQDEFEEVKESQVDFGELSLTFKYISIPMAILGRVEFGIFNKGCTKQVDSLESVNVCGKVVATYKNTFRNYEPQEIVLFDKNADKNEYEKVVIGSLLFPTRCWLPAPVSSLLHLHIDLFEFQTNKTILKEDVDLETHDAYGFSKKILTAEFFIFVSASWSLGGSQDADATSGQGKPKDADDSAQGESKHTDDSAQGESKDADDSAHGEFKDADATSGQGQSKDADDSAQGESKDVGGDVVQISRIVESCATLPKSPAVEVFSVLICYKKCMPLKIHGLLRFSFDLTWDYNNRKIDILKEDEEYLLRSSGRGNIIPVFDGPRLYQDFHPLSVICDLKDTLDNSSIKGYQNSDYDSFLPRNKQLCSIFRGDHGFAALHYAIFSSAVQATLKVRYTENGLKCVGIPVFGSFCAQYNGFNYSSEYEKKCYRIVLFKRSGKEDSVLVDQNGLIPLSRSSLVVPTDSSFRFDVHFIIGTREFSGEANIKIGTSSMSIKIAECVVEIDLKWSEVK